MRLEIECESRIGMAREVLDLFIPYKINIKRIEVDTDQRRMHYAFPDIPFDQLQTLLAAIRRIDGVEGVKTVMFTPFEQEKNALLTLLEALPDGVIAVDLHGVVTMATESAVSSLSISYDQIINQPLNKFIKGVRFNFLEMSQKTQLQSKQVRVNGQKILMEILPIFVPDEEGQAIPAGVVINVKSAARLDEQTASLRRSPNIELNLSDYLTNNIAESDSMKCCLKQAATILKLEMPVLIHGATGVGKEDLIKAMYQQWLAAQHTENSKIMYVSGEDISKEKIEMFSTGSGWCVIQSPESIPEVAQKELVRYLKQQSNSHIGMRIITVSHYPLSELRNDCGLNEELFYLISALTLKVPALSERREDILGLAELYLQDVATRLKLKKPKLSKGAGIKMKLYSWPGNLNEFRNVCLQAVALNHSDVIQVDDLNYGAQEERHQTIELIDDSLDKTMKHWEAKLLKDLYPSFPSSRQLAKKIGLSHSAVANKLRDYGIGQTATARRKEG
ncbi:sigma 54-interacting transcriptional regulator [Marinomonas sp. 15G1-11]|uniref:Sigma 54-interacting transcriptional regulator n=1 Tax=Marinomonas phaeophyticola TaxID=3004091 RepID=A0ABT4JWT4_9GAMM|nr:TyrR/PhhR family helix-turn-helix DNA-binding protein [Marinomonas sp. 15G1-11]MCZ2722832.1 sigma 54-interacting transcriptional regulator [Marinomonas sp. 15G1-11]